MTRYEQLADQAIAYTHTHMDYHENCQRLAFQLTVAYALFLECPQQKINFIRLDGNLDRTDETFPISIDTPLSLGIDGLWYFCIRIKYTKAGDNGFGYEFIKLGLKYEDQILTVHEEKDFEIDLTKPATRDAFFQHLFKDSLQRFSSPPYVQSKHIGFA